MAENSMLSKAFLKSTAHTQSCRFALQSFSISSAHRSWSPLWNLLGLPIAPQWFLRRLCCKESLPLFCKWYPGCKLGDNWPRQWCRLLYVRRLLCFVHDFGIWPLLMISVHVLALNFLVAMPVCFNSSAAIPLVSWNLPVLSYFSATLISMMEILWISCLIRSALKVDPVSLGFFDE